jgi:NitT/TauT family transport system permease protein
MAQPARFDARHTLVSAGIWAAVLAAWEAAYRLIGWKPWVFPAPSHVLESTIGMLGASQQGSLATALAVSGGRLLVGFGMSTLLGLALGIALWRWRTLDRTVGGVFLGLQTLPSVCWVPLAVLMFGLNETGILFVMLMGSAFAMTIAFRDGLRMIPPIYERAGLMMGARGWALYRHVVVPASMPAFASTLRQGFSFAWRSLMGAELLFMVQAKGVGYLLYQGREFADVAQVVAVMVVMIGVGMLVDRAAFAPLERRLHARFGLAPAAA